VVTPRNGHQPFKIVVHPMNYPTHSVELAVDKFSTLLIEQPKTRFEVTQLINGMIFQ
jgi:hypothetical protein